MIPSTRAGAQGPFLVLQLVQAAAAQQLHRQVQDAVRGLVEVVGRDGVGTAQLRAGLGLAPKARDDGRVAGRCAGAGS